MGDGLPPFRQKINNPADQATPTAADPNQHTIVGGRGTGHTYDAGSDPTVAFDTQGGGYFSCIAFDINSNASLLYVTQSPAGAKGSFFYNIPTRSRKFIVAEDNSATVFHDKNFISTDTNASSPNRDNVYVTWTVFKFDPRCVAGGGQCESPIYGSMSTDGAHTWSTPELISGNSDALCSFGNALDPLAAPNVCNLDQGSESQALPNGDLQVIFTNQNTAATDPNGQQLGVHCAPAGKSQLGTGRLNCASPSRVGADVSSGEPTCNFGRGAEECIGEFDVQLAQSLDGGLTWSERGTVNPDRGLDHYFPVVDRAPTEQQTGEQAIQNKPSDQADRVGDSYYRTERIPNENTAPTDGFASCNPDQRGNPATCDAGTGLANSDYALAGGRGEQLPYAFHVLSPVFAPPDGNQTGFTATTAAWSSTTATRRTRSGPTPATKIRSRRTVSSTTKTSLPPTPRCPTDSHSAPPAYLARPRPNHPTSSDRATAGGPTLPCAMLPACMETPAARFRRPSITAVWRRSGLLVCARWGCSR